MSGLFNLKVNNVAAEDITLNGQTVEEVWVDGVQVFDAYDPTTIPDGTLATRSSTWFVGYSRPESYSESQREESLNGQIGKKGSIKLTVQAPDVQCMDGANFVAVDWAKNTSAKWASCWLTSPLFKFLIRAAKYSSPSSYGGSVRGDYMQYELSGLQNTDWVKNIVADSSEGYTGGGWIKYEWDFEQRKCWISSSRSSRVEYNLAKKWTENMQVSATFSRHYASKYTEGDYSAYRIYMLASFNLEISNT